MRPLGRILTLAGTTVREAVRSRLLYAIMLFAIAIILGGLLLSALSYVERDRILQDVGFAAIRIFGVAIAIFVGVGLIHKEVERRTVYTILSKPISRAEFLLGKFAGLTLTVWMQVVVMSVVFAAVSLGAGAPLSATHGIVIGLLCVELALVVAIATFFSAFTTPLLATFFSCGLWVVGNLTRDLRDMGAASGLESVQLATLWLHRLLPDLDSFNFTIEAVHGLPVMASDVSLAGVYGVGYVAVVLLAAVHVFERRDLR